jgi:predicted CDP-diglyceride synthetase/phosphatidate cytidylyltransferase
VTEEKYKLTETVVYGLHGYTAVLCKNTVLNYFFTPSCGYTINLNIAAKIRSNAGDVAAIAFVMLLQRPLKLSYFGHNCNCELQYFITMNNHHSLYLAVN